MAKEMMEVRQKKDEEHCMIHKSAGRQHYDNGTKRQAMNPFPANCTNLTKSVLNI
jgi:hypothetical protein